MIGEANAGDLLRRFEKILESDSAIDEVGFVHPSQFVNLTEEAPSSSGSVSNVVCLKDGTAVFWNREHKLGISTDVLIPLYKEAKRAMMAAIQQYEGLYSAFDVSGVESSVSLDDSIEGEVMKQSRAVLLVSSDYGTAWNFRKMVLLKKQELSMLLDELLFSALVLSYAPKSEHAWCHRRWVIKLIAGKFSTLQEIVTKEFELVEKIAERSKMNYRAWYHRCWLVSYMTTEQFLHELQRSKKWAGLHVADHSCFHYRRQLMLRILEDRCCKQESVSSSYNVTINQLWKEELDWDEMLIKRYIGREALWLHRRFLSLFWIKHFLTGHTDLPGDWKHKISMNNDFSIFMDHLLQSCSIIPDDSFDDYQAQATHSATYMLWLIKQIPDSGGIELREKLKIKNLKTLLNNACPGRSSTWDSVLVYLETSDHYATENNCHSSMAIVSTELLPHSFHTTSQLKPTSHSHHPTALSCRASSASSISNGRNSSRNPTRVSVSADPKSTQLQNYDFKDTHLMKVLNRSCKAGQYNEAIYFLELMVSKGYKPDVILCTKLIKGFFNSRNIEKAIRVMQILEQYGEPDLFAYNALISGFCKANRIESANKVLDRMKSQGFKPDVVTYNIMIGSLCSRGKLGLALQVMDRLVRDNCKPTVITYTILIEAIILDGGINEAMKLLDEMLSRGLKPDMYTYNAIVRGMCREGMLDRAFDFVKCFDAKGCAPNVISYNILLRALLNGGKWEEGENLVANMCARGCEPNVVTYSILISTLCRDGKVEDGMNVLKIMKEKGLTPDAYSYDPLISCFCKEGRLDLAIELLDCMISDGCLPDIVNYNTVVAALCKNGSADQALEIFENLGEVGCPPNVSSYNTMFSALWNCGDSVRALGMVSDMVSKGIEPDEITYNSLISCLCRDGMVNEAIGLLVDMEAGGFQPTVITYNIVLLGLSKARRIVDAIEVFTAMVEKGCRPNETTYILLIEGIGFAGWRAEAMELAKSVYSLRAICEDSFKRLSRTFPMLDVYKELTL
ncbi:hypothetical protein ACLB2K_064738 [Fragaria x ananassa]